MVPAAPTVDRVALAFVAAPLFAAVTMGAMVAVLTGGVGSPSVSMGILAAFITAMVAAPATVLLGIPAYLVLYPRVRARLVGSAATGAVIAVLPWTALEIATWRVAADAFPRTLPFIGLQAIIGAGAGLVFWYVAVGAGRRKASGAC